MEDGIVLTMRGICKSFPGVRALDNVDFTAGFKGLDHFIDHASLEGAALAIIVPCTGK